MAAQVERLDLVGDQLGAQRSRDIAQPFGDIGPAGEAHGAGTGADIDGVPLEDTPQELVTFPTDLAVNDAGDLIVISFDNAHAFVSLSLPSGGFIDNGLHDLNVNAGNYGVAVAQDTILASGVIPRFSSASCIVPKSANRQRATICGSPFSPVLSPISSRP